MPVDVRRVLRRTEAVNALIADFVLRVVARDDLLCPVRRSIHQLLQQSVSTTTERGDIEFVNDEEVRYKVASYKEIFLTIPWAGYKK